VTAICLPYRPLNQPPTVRQQHFICPKAEWDGVSEQSRGRRLYWTMRSLAQAYLTTAEACPGVASGRTKLRLAIVPNMHTVEYRPVALRVLISACYCCPPDTPNILDDPKVTSGWGTFQQLPDAPDGTARWAWECHRPGCTMTGLHDEQRWAIEASMLHQQATDHKALAAVVQQ
jgi:hypothetical protein